MHSDLPPTPRALSDEELQEVLEKAKAEGGGVLAAMQILEAQAQLRETDKSELRAWELSRESQFEPAPAPVEQFAEQVATDEDEHLLESLETVSEPNADIEAAPVVEPVVEPIIETVFERVATPAPVVQDIVVRTKRGAKDPSHSQFWVWLTISGSLLPFGISLWLRSLGLTFAQSLVAAILGMFASAGVVAVGAIAGKRSSLPTLVLSRAAFGVYGNLAPAVILVVSRLFWALVLVILGYILIAQSTITNSVILGPATEISFVSIFVLIGVVAVSVLLSSVGGRKLALAQKISGSLGLATALIIGFSRIITHGSADFVYQEGSWLRAFGASVVIFAVFGLAWSSASSDYASGLPVNVRGLKVAGWALLAMGVIPVLLVWLGLLVFGDVTSSDFAATFDVMVAGTNLSMFNLLVQLSLAASLITTIAMTLRSSSMSFESIQLKLKPGFATPIIAVVAVLLAIFGLGYLGTAGFWFNLHGYALFLAVPVAAWSGVFVSDVLVRRIAYHEVSLSRGYGFYKAVNPANLAGWLAAVVRGWGLLRSGLIEFQWLGYLSDYASNYRFWEQSNLGVVIAFAIGLLLPVSLGIPRIKRQEAEVLLIESRRNDLRDVLELID